MTAKELMIGDLVLIKPEMKPIKVAAVHQKKIGYHIRADKLNWVRLGLLEPIPLTPKILEKNGFEYEPYKLAWHLPNGFRILMSEIWALYLDDCLKAKLYNVHQLQHALRLCELSDIANNLKVE